MEDQGRRCHHQRVDAELTIEQAAEQLNVSRTRLVELLESGELAFRGVEAERRIRASDLVAYQERAEAEQQAALDELTEQAQKLGLGY